MDDWLVGYLLLLYFSLCAHSGIMFPIKAKQNLPVSQIVLHAVAVRGQLGPLTVWVSRNDVMNDNNNDNHNVPADDAPPSREYTFPLQSRYWDKVYQRVHGPSVREFQWLDFSATPIVLRPGQVRAVYIHSTLPGDEAIVYDNSDVTLQRWHYPPGAALARQRPTPRHDDAYIRILSGKAHLSPRPFGQTPIWGWGNAWRDHREFVGQIQYGVRFQLWQPPLTGTVYGPRFREAVQTLLACQRRPETSPVARLPDECLYYILNMCKWDWWDDTPSALQEQRRRYKQKQRQLRLQQQQEAEAEQQQQQSSSSAEASPRNGRSARVVVPQPMDETSDRPAADDNDRDATMNNDDDDEVAPDEDEEEEEEEDDDDDDDDFVDDDEEDFVESDSDESIWERQHGYRANAQVFTYHDISSDDDDDDDDSDNGDGDDPQAAALERQAWFRRHFARIHILRALAQADDDDNAVEVVRLADNMQQDDDDDDSSDESEYRQVDDEESDGNGDYEALSDG